MKLNNLLMLFVILMVALTLVSAIGGSIKVKENFWEDIEKEESIGEQFTDSTIKKVVVKEEQKEKKPEEKPEEKPVQKPVEKPVKESGVEPFQGSMFAGIN